MRCGFMKWRLGTVLGHWPIIIIVQPEMLNPCRSYSVATLSSVRQPKLIRDVPSPPPLQFTINVTRTNYICSAAVLQSLCADLAV